MPIFKRTISCLPYLLVLLLVVPLFAEAQGVFSIKGILFAFVNNVFGFLLGAGGLVLDFAVNKYVIGFGEVFGVGGVGIGTAIDLTWAMVRDMFNITFIFGLVWLGFKMILRTDDASTRRTLITLIVAALLVNFSLFFTKAVADFTNILASEIAESFVPPGGVEGDDVEISASFMQLFQLSTVWQSEEGEAIAIDNKSYMYIFGTAIVFLVGAFTFFAGGIMLIIRFAALCIYMVFSPLMFLGYVFPGLRTFSQSLIKGFLGRAFFAPAYLMLVYLSAFIMGEYNDSAASFSAAFSGRDEAAVAASIGPFILICVFLIASVVVGSKMSTTGASTAISIGTNIGGRAQRMVNNTARGTWNTAAGTGRFAARQTAGRGARLVSNGSERTRRSLDRGLGTMSQNGAVSRATARTLDRTIGAGLRSAENASVAGSETVAQQRDRVNKQNARLGAVAQETSRHSRIHEEVANARNNIPDENKSVDEQKEARKARTDAINAIGNQVRRMSDQEVLDMVDRDKQVLKNPEIAQHLTDSHVKTLRESGKYTNDEVTEISKSRDTAMIDTAAEVLDSTNTTVDELNTALDQLAQNVQNMPAERLAGMDVETLTNQRVASNLTEKQIEDMKNSGRLTSSQISDIRTARETGLSDIANGKAPGIANGENPDHVSAMRDRGKKLFQGSAQVAGQLPASVYTQKGIVSHITPSALQQRIRNGLSEADASVIEENLNEYLASRSATESEKRAWRTWSDKSTEGARINITA